MVPESFVIPGLRDNCCFLNGKKEASHCFLYSEIPLVLAISLISLNRLVYIVGIVLRFSVGPRECVS